MTMTSPALSDYETSCEAAPAFSVETLSAALLRTYRRQLVDGWATAMHHLPGSNYSVRPMDEIHRSCEECVLAYVALLEDDPDPLWRFVERICQMRAAMQFPSAEVMEAFMLFLDTAADILGSEVPDRTHWDAVMKAYRSCTRTAIKAFVNAYWIHLELAQTAL